MCWPLAAHLICIARAFRVGECAQSLFGRVNALLYKSDDAPTYVIMVARSFARDISYALHLSVTHYDY